MKMFGGIKKMWSDAAITAAMLGVIRESEKGNAPEVQRWYFVVKKEAYKQSLKDGVTPSEIEEQALSIIKPDQSALYQSIVKRLSQNGGPLEEIDEWLKTHKPI